MEFEKKDLHGFHLHESVKAKLQILAKENKSNMGEILRQLIERAWAERDANPAS